MKKSITLLLGLLLSFSSLSQYSQNIDGMSRKEVKSFLLKSENDKIQNHMKKYTDGQVVGGFLGIAGTSIIVITQLTKKDADPRNELAMLEGLENIIIGGLIAVTGIVIWATSDVHFDKAKELHFESYTPLDQSQIIIRNDSEIYKSISQ